MITEIFFSYYVLLLAISIRVKVVRVKTTIGSRHTTKGEDIKSLFRSDKYNQISHKEYGFLRLEPFFMVFYNQK